MTGEGNESIYSVNEPEILVIGGKCYRNNAYSSKPPEKKNKKEMTDDTVEKPGSNLKTSLDRRKENNSNVYCVKTIDGSLLEMTYTKIDEGVFSKISGISNYKLRAIKNSFYDKIKEIAKKFDVTVSIPELCTGNESIVLKGSYSNNLVEDASKAIIEFVDSLDIKFDKSHFISIPLSSSGELERNYWKFREIVKHAYEKVGKNAPLEHFRKINTLHLTVCMLDLNTYLKKEEVLPTFRNICSKYIREYEKQKPLVVRICGLDIMESDAKETYVLYGNVLENEGGTRLQILCNNIQQDLEKYGFLNMNKSVFLHVSIIRTNPNIIIEQPRKSFDSSVILENFRDYDFGCVTIDKIHLSDLKFIDPKTSYYKCLEEIKI